MLALGPTGVLEAEWSLTTVVTNIVISIAHAHALSMIIKFIKKDVDAIIIILTILVMMTLMMIVALEVADGVWSQPLTMYARSPVRPAAFH